MPSHISVTLRCEQCGHTWTARNIDGKSRQCSKCRSRKIIEVDCDADALVTERPETDMVKASQKVSFPPSLSDDPEILKKVKELELAKLDRQIREMREQSFRDGFAERLVINHLSLLVELSQANIIDEDTINRLMSYCPWCGAEREDGLVYVEYPKDHPTMTGYRCASCKHWVPY